MASAQLVSDFRTYLEKAQHLVECRLIREGQLRGDFSLTAYPSDHGTFQIEMEADPPDQEAFEAFLMRFRIFTLEKDGLSTSTIHNRLRESILDPALLGELEQIKMSLKRSRKQCLAAIMGPTKAYTEKYFFETILYGSYFHNDRKRQAEYEALSQDMRFMGHRMLLNYCRTEVVGIFFTARFIDHAFNRNAIL